MNVRGLYAHRERLWRGFFKIRTGAPALEAALQQREQTRVPVTHNEQQQEWHGEVVFVADGVPDRHGEVAADQKLDPGNDAEAFAILRRLRFFTALFDAIFRSALEGTLDAEQGFEDGPGVGHSQADTERHEKRQIEKSLVPLARE